MSNKLYITWEQVIAKLRAIENSINEDLPYAAPYPHVYGVPKGGMIVSGFMSHVLHSPFVEQADFILDDLVDSGVTRDKYKKLYPDKQFIALFDKQTEPELKDKWIVFPWEKDHPGGEDSIEQNIVRQLQYLGEDVTREGLIDTPKRIVKSWKELYKGYDQKPEDLLTTFMADGYDQIVLLKDIEMYSMCEHHMLPFIGKAHVAYIPDKKVIGISKLARLVDMYARRLQIQERIGEQVSTALMERLQPKGAACIIEAQHLCMKMRGVNKQNSVMITSSLKGVFLKQSDARMELMKLIK